MPQRLERGHPGVDSGLPVLSMGSQAGWITLSDYLHLMTQDPHPLQLGDTFHDGAGGRPSKLDRQAMKDVKFLHEQLMMDLVDGPMTHVQFVRDVVRPQFGRPPHGMTSAGPCCMLMYG